MKSRYVEINHTQMAAFMEGELGFFSVNQPGCGEFVWARNVETKSGKQFPYVVQVFSSVDKRRGTTRDCGEDAIRVVITDTETARHYPLGRVYRTKNALPNLKKKCREAFIRIIHEGCPKCGSLMTERKGKHGKFLGCTKYPTCTGTKQLGG